MKLPPPSRADPVLSLPTLAVALGLIAVLALVLPTVAVRLLHAHRTEAADRDLRTIADALRAVHKWPAGAGILAGPGERPRAQDDRWNRAAVLPLTRATLGADHQFAPDPWGNAYVAKIDVDGGATWVLSAGPDGLLQTAFQGEDVKLLGDDRGARIR
jgi:type II secretory pathway pseudopilin PulG